MHHVEMAGAFMVVMTTAACRWVLMPERVVITKSEMTLLLVEFWGALILLLMLPRFGAHAMMFWMGCFLVPRTKQTWVKEVLESAGYTFVFCCALMCI